MTGLLRRYPRTSCCVAFAVIFGSFLTGWHWFIFTHRASFAEWAVAMAGLFAAGALLERKR